MVSFGHTAVGVIVGATAYNFLGQSALTTGLITTGFVGVLSHYFMDAIPHGHFFMPQGFKKGIIKIIIFDLSLSLVLFLGLVYLKNGLDTKFLYILFGIGGSQLPDVLDGLIYTDIIKARGFLKIENAIHEAIHWHGRGSQTLILGKRDIWQASVIIFALALVLFKW